MRKLVSANFARLLKDKVFWAGIIFMLVFGFYMPFSNHMAAVKFKETGLLDSCFFNYALVIGILSAAFCSLFTGTEYSDGTIRNKVTAGHTRAAIYLSGLIVNIAASLLMCLGYVIAASISGIVFTGFLKSGADLVLPVMFGTVLMIIAFCAVFTFVSLLNQNKASVTAICLIGIIVLFILSIFISAELNQPKVYEGYIYADENGDIVTVDDAPNLNYIEGTKRVVYEFLMDFLPTGQSMQYSRMVADHQWQMLLYSLLITIGVTGSGIILFQRKDIN